MQRREALERLRIAVAHLQIAANMARIEVPNGTVGLAIVAKEASGAGRLTASLEVDPFIADLLAIVGEADEKAGALPAGEREQLARELYRRSVERQPAMFVVRTWHGLSDVSRTWWCTLVDVIGEIERERLRGSVPLDVVTEAIEMAWARGKEDGAKARQPFTKREADAWACDLLERLPLRMLTMAPDGSHTVRTVPDTPLTEAEARAWATIRPLVERVAAGEWTGTVLGAIQDAWRDRGDIPLEVRPLKPGEVPPTDDPADKRIAGASEYNHAAEFGAACARLNHAVNRTPPNGLITLTGADASEILTGVVVNGLWTPAHGRPEPSDAAPDSGTALAYGTWKPEAPYDEDELRPEPSEKPPGVAIGESGTWYPQATATHTIGGRLRAGCCDCTGMIHTKGVEGCKHEKGGA